MQLARTSIDTCYWRENVRGHAAAIDSGLYVRDLQVHEVQCFPGEEELEQAQEAEDKR